jgi:alpha-mannosidase
MKPFNSLLSLLRRICARSVKMAFFLALAFQVATPATAEEFAPESASRITDVWVVFKTHFDIGYTDLVTNVLHRYRGEMMDKALGVMEANETLPESERFAWTVPGWPLTHILGPLQTPERRVRIEKAVRSGALAVHAAPFTLHTESFDLEDLARGLHYSAQIARDYGRPLPRSAKMTDVPEHCWVLPTVLANAGIRFLQIGCNSACQYPRFPRLFYWEGPDGSRVLCNYTPNYGSGLVPPKDWPSRNYLAMIMTGDNHGPPSAAEVQSQREKFARQLPGVRLHIGTLDDFLAAVEAEKPNLQVVRGDTPDTWIHGLMSMPEATKIARNIRPLEPALDSLDTHLKLLGLITPPLAQPLAEAYENSLLYGEHTFGMNGEFGGRRLWPLEEWKKKLPRERQEKFLQSFEDKQDYIRRTDKIVTGELKSRLDLLAKSVKTDGARFVVWNALPWPRSGLVEVNGQPFFAKDVPANGYKTFPLSEVVPLEKSDTLDASFYRVRFDLERGGIASLVEKKSGRELADQSSPYALGQFLHERFSKVEVDRFFKAYSRMPGGWALEDLGKPGMPESGAQAVLDNVRATAPGQPNPGAMGKPGIPTSDYVATSPKGWQFATQRNSSADVVTLTADDTRGLAKAFQIKFTFSRHEPFVEVDWSVTDKTPDKMPEGGWLCFPFAAKQPQFTVGRPGSLIDPAKDIIPGANRHLYAVASGITITGADHDGVSLCPLDSPLVSLDHPGLWWWSMDFVPKTPTVFVNLYNNKWNTNFPLWQEGSWTERVRFWPTGDLVVPGYEARVPLLAVTADGPGGKLPPTQGGLSVSRPGVLVTAFGANPDGTGTLLRVWEQAGVSGDLAVTLPTGAKFTTATPVNLRGEKVGEPMRIVDGKLALSIRGFAPASYVLD